MKMGAEPKKVAILGGLLLVGGYTFYANVLSGPGSSPPPQADRTAAVAAPAPVQAPAAAAEAAPVVRRSANRTRSEEFRPSLKRRPEDRIDPMTVDPMLRMDLLAKVQQEPLMVGSRNVFQFGMPGPPPAPKGPEPKINPRIPVRAAMPVAPPAPAGPPPPPPIQLKYYGFSTAKANSRKTAFFLDGDDILVAGEGETVKKRYKVVRIGVNSVVVEDLQFKNQQPLPLAEEAPPMG
jgi:hypothetical protein